MKKKSLRVALHARLPCSVVFAAAQSDSTTDHGQASVGLQEIMVTARRVDENVKRVPVTIVAVTPALQKIVPGYQGGARFVG